MLKKLAITRLVVLVIVLLNQTLLVFGMNPLPFSEEEIYLGVSSVIGFVVVMRSWWKNNPITKEAQEAQKVLQKLKEGE